MQAARKERKEMKKRKLRKCRVTAAAIVVFAVPFITGFACGRATQEEQPRPCTVAAAAEAPTKAARTMAAEAAAAEYTTLEVEATAYCACAKCCGKSDGITATGTRATEGRTIAVDPQVIPYGTEIVINGQTYIAEDCGGAIKGNAVDIYHETHESALQFGRQRVTAYVKY